MSTLAAWRTNPLRAVARLGCLTRYREAVAEALAGSAAFALLAAPAEDWIASGEDAGAITAATAEQCAQRVVFGDWADPENGLAFTAEELRGVGTTVCVLASGEDAYRASPIEGTGAAVVVNATIETIYELQVPDRLWNGVAELEMVVESLVTQSLNEAAQSLLASQGKRWLGDGVALTQTVSRVGDFDDDNDLETRRLQAIATWSLGPGGGQ